MPSMAPEVNIDSILALEKQIEEGLGDVIQLKRARNSLLNISTLMPPELLGQVFRWNVIPDYDFGELEKGCYNFLLVCHHWFEIASGTPELWTYWGNTLKLWSQRYQRSGTAPLDLILHAHRSTGDKTITPFDGPLRDALRDRVACDSIRSIHLRGRDTDLLHSIISSLTLDGGGIRDSSVESLRLEHTSLDVSAFLTRYRFPRLRHLHLLTNARITSWDHLRIRAASLTTLSLGFAKTTTNPTTSQVLSILASFPDLQDLLLYETTIPHDDGDGSAPRVSLHRLKKLELFGDCNRVFRLLDRLEHPDRMNFVHLHLSECAEDNLQEFLEPYLRDRIRRDGRFQDMLGMHVSYASSSITFGVNVLGEFDIPTTQPRNCLPSILVSAVFRGGLSQGAGKKLCVNLIAVTPRDRVVKFTGGASTRAIMDVFVTMPNIKDLYLIQSVVSDTFLQQDPPSHAKSFPSLGHLCLDDFTLQDDDDWRSLIAYLTRQTSGGQVISLRLRGKHPPIPPEVVREIEGLVYKLISLV